MIFPGQVEQKWMSEISVNTVENIDEVKLANHAYFKII